MTTQPIETEQPAPSASKWLTVRKYNNHTLYVLGNNAHFVSLWVQAYLLGLEWRLWHKLLVGISLGDMRWSDGFGIELWLLWFNAYIIIHPNARFGPDKERGFISFWLQVGGHLDFKLYDNRD